MMNHKKGRYRYFHQWNVEVFGLPSVESESEIIEFASVLFAKLGIGDSLICINHRELVESFIKKTYPGFENDRDSVIGDSFRRWICRKLPVQYADFIGFCCSARHARAGNRG